MNDAFDPTALIETLDREGVSYLVIGGIAAGLYGSNRNTYDLDIVPAPGLENARRLERALAALDARIRGIDADKLGIGLDAETLVDGANFTLATRHGDLDVMPLTEGGLNWDDLRARAVELQLRDDLAVAVVGKDDLIAMKRAAGRPQDIEDIAQITAGVHLARNARSRVRLTGPVRGDVPDRRAAEAADIATLSYEQDVRFEVVADPSTGGRRLEIEADLPGFAKSHAELWASIVARKVESQDVIDGHMRPVVDGS